MITPEQLAASNTEHGHQAALFCWASLEAIKINYPELRWLFAIPNGGLRDARTAGKLKAEGVKAGVWDIFLPHWGTILNAHNGMFIELKTEDRRNHKNGGLSDDQVEFGLEMHIQGYKCVVCYSWIEARDAILQYLGKV